jgi:hypothetical protein
VPYQRRPEELEAADHLMESLVVRQHQLRAADQSLLLVDVGYSCQEQVSIDHPAVPFV